MTHDLPSNDADNGRLVVPADQCDDDYYSDEAIAKREAHLSAKYGHLKSAGEARQRERERVAEANRRSKDGGLTPGDRCPQSWRTGPAPPT